MEFVIQWKEIIIKQKTYKSIITFHPAYLLRQPDQKKFSWEDLKIIHKKIDELNKLTQNYKTELNRYVKNNFNINHLNMNSDKHLNILSNLLVVSDNIYSLSK